MKRGFRPMVYHPILYVRILIRKAGGLAPSHLRSCDYIESVFEPSQFKKRSHAKPGLPGNSEALYVESYNMRTRNARRQLVVLALKLALGVLGLSLGRRRKSDSRKDPLYQCWPSRAVTDTNAHHHHHGELKLSGCTLEPKS